MTEVKVNELRDKLSGFNVKLQSLKSYVLRLNKDRTN